MRITKVTTRTGDKGKTGLATGEKVFKSDKIISALGDVDELSSIIGVCALNCKDNDTKKFLHRIQNNLFDIGGQISLNSFENSIINEKMITDLDKQIDALNSELDPLQEFILPSGDSFSSNIHVARSVTRRAERTTVDLFSDTLEENPVIMYLNRLSDYFFVLSRNYNKKNNISETTWKR